MPGAPKLASIQPDQLEEASQMLARAFFDDPMVEYITPDPARRERHLPWFFRLATRYGQQYGETYTLPDKVDGAGIWLPPGSTMVNNVRMIRMGLLAGLFKFGPRPFIRYLSVTNSLERLHKRDVPPEHWYLFVLGVDPSRQGQGVGGTIIQPVLERADKDRLPCYLETTKERNLDFYGKHGFDVVVEGHVGESPPYWTMKREPVG